MEKIYAKICIIAVLCSMLVLSEKSVYGIGVERDGRWLTYNGVHSYIIGMDMQGIASLTDDYIYALDRISQSRINYIRIWVYPIWMDPEVYNLPYAYSRTTHKWDLDSYDSAYWTRLRDIIEAAKDRNIIVCVSIFNTLIAEFNIYNTAFCESKNTNGFFTDPGTGDFRPQWHDLNYSEGETTLKSKQEALVDKVILEVGSYDNVILEIQNENGWGIDDVTKETSWQNYFASYADGKTSRIIGVHAQDDAGTNILGLDQYWTEDYNDILTFHFYSGNPTTISRLLHGAQNKGKVIFDNESGCNRNSDHTVNNTMLNKTTRNNWGLFTSGGYISLYDEGYMASNPSDPYFETIAQRFKVQRDIAETLRFWEMSPIDGSGNEVDSKVTNGPGSSWQVIANLGSQYLVYFWGTKRTKNVKIDLPAGTYNYKWYDTRDGSTEGSGQVSGGGVKTITSPGTGVWDGNAGLVLTLSRR